jgi:hypothetical protein
MLEKPLFTTTGLKCLPESDYRIVLWRNTIQLFYEYKRPNLIGPFKAAGLSFKVEPLFLSSEQGSNLEPDIVASGEMGWLVMELTTQPNSKKPKIDAYKSIYSRDLGQYGLSVHDGKPDILTSRLSFVDDGPCCQIIVKDALRVEKEDYLLNQDLKSEVSEQRGDQSISLILHLRPGLPTGQPYKNSKDREAFS